MIRQTVNRAFFGRQTLKPADFTQEQLKARVAAKKKHRDLRTAAADGSATDHQLDLLAVLKTTT
jgi:hypothetical protein